MHVLIRIVIVTNRMEVKIFKMKKINALYIDSLFNNRKVKTLYINDLPWRTRSELILGNEEPRPGSIPIVCIFILFFHFFRAKTVLFSLP